MIRMLACFFFLIINFTGFSFAAETVTYYVHTTKGSDQNNGTDITKPWKTIDRINRQQLQPGDSVLFARGEIFRGFLKASGGDENKRVVYASYGTGDKPKLFGSIQKNKKSDWKSLGNNHWETREILFEGKPIDVGNIIFDNEKDFGIKVPLLSRVNSQGVFWSDTANRRVVLYSATNPAAHYSNLELALTRDIIKQNWTSHITYMDLDLRYTGAHGIGGDSTHHITVSGLDISCIGGGYLYGFDTVRYGNGVEFYNAAHTNIVEKCRFSQIYDVAMTSQGDKPGHKVYDLIFRNNIIDKCEQSFELWMRGEGSSIRNVYFENNTSTNAGYGILHPQRPDTNGTFLLFWGFSGDVDASDIYIRNNIFSNAKNWGSYWHNSGDMNKITIDNNCWDIKTNVFSKVRDTKYDINTGLSEYKRISGHDQHSIFKNPMLTASGFKLSSKSPCIDTGLTLEKVKDDFTGTKRLSGSYDIGACEFK